MTKRGTKKKAEQSPVVIELAAIVQKISFQIGGSILDAETRMFRAYCRFCGGKSAEAEADWQKAEQFRVVHDWPDCVGKLVGDLVKRRQRGHDEDEIDRLLSLATEETMAPSTPTGRALQDGNRARDDYFDQLEARRAARAALARQPLAVPPTSSPKEALRLELAAERGLTADELLELAGSRLGRAFHTVEQATAALRAARPLGGPHVD